MVQMYGAGLERIVELIEDEETRDRLAADELVAGLLMIHDLYPVPLEERVAQALDTVRPYMESHGGNVELLGHRGRGRAAAARGELQVVPGVVVDARAGGAAGAAGGGAGPARHGRGGGRSRRTRTPASPACRCRSCRQTARPSWHALDIDAAGDARDRRTSPACRSSSQTWTGRCSRIATRARAVTAPLDGGVLDRRRALVSELRPAATSCRRPDARWTTSTSSSQPVPLLREAEADQGGAVKPLDEAVATRRKALMVSGLRGLAQPKPPTPVSADERCDLCSTTRAARPPAHAQPLRAPDRLRVRELLGAPVGRRRTSAPRAAARCGSTASSCRRSCGRSSGSRSGWPSSCTRA